jgi:hypothetical protein
MEKYLDSVEDIVFSLIDHMEKFLLFSVDIIYRIYDYACRFFEFVVCTVTGIIDDLYRQLRLLTIPFNYFIVLIWNWWIIRQTEREPLDEIGVHYIQSLPGGGKSSLAKHKADEYMHKTGKSIYITHPFEKPKTDEKGNKYVYHRLVDLKNYYGDRKKLKRFNFKMYYALFIDEFHLLNNNRYNKEKEYNNFFKALLDDLISIRHTGLDRCYILSQLPSNDVQLMGILAYYHVVKLKKGVNYWRWISNGRFERVPIKWRIKTYTLDAESLKKVLYRKWIKLVNMNYLDDFETRAMKNKDNDLPLDYYKN